MFKKLNKYKIWVILMLASFAYQLPFVVLTSMDRLNPRLYDLFFIWGLFLFWNKLLKPIDNSVVKIWRKMVILMTFCCLVYAFLIPPTTYAYSLFYLFKYIEGYFVLKMLFANRKLINVDLVEKIIILGGVFVALYSFPQSLRSITIEMEIAPGKFLILPPGSFTGPFASYFALSQFSTISTLFSINRLIRTRNKKQKIFLLFVTFLVAFPAFSNGSRTGLFLLLFSTIAFFLLSKKINYLFSLIIVMIGFLFYFSASKNMNIGDYLKNENYTISRIEQLNNDERQSIIGRLTFYDIFHLSDYDYGILMPICGSGFYVSPRNGIYRIGYGFHNNYIFSFEQMGILGLIFFIMLLFRTIRLSHKYRFTNELSLPVCSLVLAYLILNFAGQTFWHGFGNGEINTLLIFIMALSVEPRLLK